MTSSLVRRRSTKLSFEREHILDQTGALTHREAKCMYEDMTGLHLPYMTWAYANWDAWEYIYSEVKLRLLGAIENYESDEYTA